MEFEWNSRDRVSFKLYKEVIESRNTQFFIWLESDNKEIDLVDLRNGNPEYRFNNFLIKENIESNSISFCPNIAGCPAYFRIKTNVIVRVDIIKKDGTAGDELILQPGEIKMELNPSGMRMYKATVIEEIKPDIAENAEEKKNDNKEQNESIPEFFGGSFTSSSVQSSASPSSDSIETISNQIDDSDVFTGSFSSENASESFPETDEKPEHTDAAPQTTNSVTDSATPLFPDMFSTFEERKDSPNNGEQANETSPETVKEQSTEQTEVLEPSGFGIQSGAPISQEMPVSGSVTGFSVPYIETEGIRERRQNVQGLQQNNDKTALEVEKLEKQIAELESKSRALAESKSSLISHLEVLQREYDKDYSKYQTDIDEIKGKYAVDQSILEFYKDRDLVPIEDLLKQADELVKRVEEQIRLFVSVQQNKSDGIEKSLKVGKKE